LKYVDVDLYLTFVMMLTDTIPALNRKLKIPFLVGEVCFLGYFILQFRIIQYTNYI
jgi:hypothetical protein